MATFCDSPCLVATEPTVCQARCCIIRQSTRGDRVATELLFERVYGAVYQHAKRICRGADDAQDLAQETLLLAFEGLDQLKNPQLLLHWISKIAWNRHRERLRISKFAPPTLDEFTESRHSCYVCAPAQPVDRLVGRETAASLARAVRALPPSLHHAFQLRVLDQLSTRDAALRLHTTEMAVRTRLRRARRLLLAALDPPPPTP